MSAAHENGAGHSRGAPHRRSSTPTTSRLVGTVLDTVAENAAFDDPSNRDRNDEDQAGVDTPGPITTTNEARPTPTNGTSPATTGSSPNHPNGPHTPAARPGLAMRAVTSTVTYIADRSRVHHWYWCLGLLAVVLYTAQAITHPASNIWRNLGYTIVVYGTATIMMVEQCIAKYVMARKVMVAEFLISGLVVACSIAGWTLWSVRHQNPLFEPIGSYFFDLIEVALMLRFAYRSLVGNFEEYREHATRPTHREWWDQSLEDGHYHELPVYPPASRARHSTQSYESVRHSPRLSHRYSYNKQPSSARSSASYASTNRLRASM